MAESLRQRLAMPFPPPTPAAPTTTAPLESDAAEATAEEGDNSETAPVATLGHVLTNVVILYEFLLELSAVVQVRGSLFEEAGYN